MGNVVGPANVDGPSLLLSLHLDRVDILTTIALTYRTPFDILEPSQKVLIHDIYRITANGEIWKNINFVPITSFASGF